MGRSAAYHSVKLEVSEARTIHDQTPWSFYRTQTDDDLKAIFAYPQTVNPVKHRVDNMLADAVPGVRGTHAWGDTNVAPN